MIEAKPGVKVEGLSKEIILALATAAAVYAQFGCKLVWTSGLDGKHKPKSGNTSLHYSGNAIDLRLPSRCLGGVWKRHSSEIDWAVLRELKAVLEPHGFDVLLEVEGHHPGKPFNMHIHIEFDKK